MNELIMALNDYLLLILAMLGTIVGIVEKSKKLPFKPFTKIFKSISKACKDDELYNKVDRIATRQEEFNDKICELQYRHDEDEADRLRYEILMFERTLRHLKKNETVTQEEFMTIFDMMEKYRVLIKKRNLTNNKFEKAEIYINKKYSAMHEKIEVSES